MTADPLTEEPWEAELSARLAQLPPVDPPAGFIDTAIDHRPLYAGRILAAMASVTVALVALVAWTGVVERAGVVPPIDDLVVKHDVTARAGFAAGSDQSQAVGIDSPLTLPEGFERAGTVAAEDLRQAVYARGDESVSVFVQDGRVDWSGLPEGGLTDLDGLPAWVDGGRRIAVIEAAGSTVTVVGLAPDELQRTLEETPRAPSGFGERIGDLADAVAEVFGYAPAG